MNFKLQLRSRYKDCGARVSVRSAGVQIFYEWSRGAPDLSHQVTTMVHNTGATHFHSKKEFWSALYAAFGSKIFHLLKFH